MVRGAAHSFSFDRIIILATSARIIRVILYHVGSLVKVALNQRNLNSECGFLSSVMAKV
jgi:hypothetical protein